VNPLARRRNAHALQTKIDARRNLVHRVRAQGINARDADPTPRIFADELGHQFIGHMRPDAVCAEPEHERRINARHHSLVFTRTGLARTQPLRAPRTKSLRKIATELIGRRPDIRVHINDHQRSSLAAFHRPTG
jgi:hypothetical protein